METATIEVERVRGAAHGLLHGERLTWFSYGPNPLGALGVMFVLLCGILMGGLASGFSPPLVMEAMATGLVLFILARRYRLRRGVPLQVTVRRDSDRVEIAFARRSSGTMAAVDPAVVLTWTDPLPATLARYGACRCVALLSALEQEEGGVEQGRFAALYFTRDDTSGRALARRLAEQLDLPLHIAADAQRITVDG